MADIVLASNECETMAHSPSLGCSGLTNSGCNVLVSSNPQKEKVKSTHKIQFSILPQPPILVCTHPAMAETVVEAALRNNMLRMLRVNELRKQTTIKGSRFDFSGVDEQGVEFIAEVKAVPSLGCPSGNMGEEVAFFPDGYIRPKDVGKKPQSERANKHVQELTEMKRECGKEKRTIMLYVVQRGDAQKFVISPRDPIYLESCKIAQEAGVEFYAIQMKWIREDDSVKGYLIGEEAVIVCS